MLRLPLLRPDSPGSPELARPTPTRLGEGGWWEGPARGSGPSPSDELDEVAPGRSQSIEISDFVDLGAIEPVYFDRTYYVAPRGKEFTKVYELLHAALSEANKVGVATFVMRNKQYLTALRAEEKVLVLQTLHWADEVRDPGEELPELPSGKAGQTRPGTRPQRAAHSCRARLPVPLPGHARVRRVRSAAVARRSWAGTKMPGLGAGKLPGRLWTRNRLRPAGLPAASTQERRPAPRGGRRDGVGLARSRGPNGVLAGEGLQAPFGVAAGALPSDHLADVPPVFLNRLVARDRSRYSGQEPQPVRCVR
ncbi:Ku protein [Streptomyces sp. NPDC015139]|uniref:Ku protein n=1 Tax=Streptomyces sp. NPDC015139 TaxID=3364942 RepID=UPI0036FA77C9